MSITPRGRLTTSDISKIDVLLEGLSEMRGESIASHRAIEGNLHSINSNLDGVVATQRQHGEAIAKAEVICRHRHARDTEESRRVQSIDQRLGAMEGGSAHRAASRKDLWAALAGLAGLMGVAVAAAKLMLGGR
jgi:hypothetical protein